MENTNANFYTGYEGEPEVVFALQDFPSGKLHAWEGHVDAVLQAIPPGTGGSWDGLLLPYHLATGCWDNGEETVVEDLPLFASQLAAVDASCFEPETDQFFQALQVLVQRAMAERRTLLISRS
ncbi:hypothetical protein I2I05_13395 [Hymenobacter sp. BT683]|uniref:Barstar (barnase inhibitor) domain-containing protein n=1 Tax=Hymenobacter jeongseonensis TaxID=2791027 RepID=A0ABS0IJ42_9BACT|nr:hypothetical protein [Hymenobacter jeongseonensis]MBF9238394.1 hypothetical protein [Hymenobacter jeongseonensis]